MLIFKVLENKSSWYGETVANSEPLISIKSRTKQCVNARTCNSVECRRRKGGTLPQICVADRWRTVEHKLFHAINQIVNVVVITRFMLEACLIVSVTQVTDSLSSTDSLVQLLRQPS